MKLIPVSTEKSMSAKKAGNYTFRVPAHATKADVRKAVEDIFDVHVVRVHTITIQPTVKKTLRGVRQVIKGGKKAIVTLKDKEKIDIFEEVKKKRKKKK